MRRGVDGELCRLDCSAFGRHGSGGCDGSSGGGGGGGEEQGCALIENSHDFERIFRLVQIHARCLAPLTSGWVVLTFDKFGVCATFGGCRARALRGPLVGLLRDQSDAACVPKGTYCARERISYRFKPTREPAVMLSVSDRLTPQQSSLGCRVLSGRRLWCRRRRRGVLVSPGGMGEDVLVYCDYIVSVVEHTP